MTQVKRAKDNLNEGEEKYRQLFENLSDAAFLVDLQTGLIVDTTMRGATLLGRSHDEIVGMQQTELYPPAKADEYRHRFTRHTNQGHVVDYEAEVIRKNGTIVPVTISSSALTIGGRRLVLGIFRDITKRKQAEENIKQAAEEWRTTFDSITDLVFITDKDFRFIRVNKTFADVFKMKPTELIDSPCYEILHGTNEPVTNCPYKQTIKTKKPATAEFFEPHLGIHLELSTSPIFNEKGEVVASVHVARDITERKRAEEALRQAKEKLETRVQERTAELDKANKALRIDITERKRAEEALQESESKLRSILSSMKDLVFVFDKVGRFTSYHGATEELYVPAEKFIGKKYSQVMPPQVNELIAKAFNMNRKGEVDEFDYWLEIGGETKYYSAKFSPILLDGAFAGAVVVVRDITERKRAEEALKESEELSSSLLDNAPNPISVINPDTSIRYINPALEKLTGFSSAEVIGRKSPYPWWQKEKQQQYSRDFEEAMRKGEYRIERLFQRKNGEQFWVDMTSTAMTGDGKLRYFLSNWVDITERKRAEEALRRSEEGFRNIYEKSPIGIELYDSNGRLITVNKACLDIFGVSDVAEVKGFNLFEDPNLTDEVKERLRKGETVRLEATFDFEEVKKRNLYNTSKSGTIHNEVVITPLGLRRGKPLGGYLLQVQDVTERKKVEQALRKSEENFRALAENANDGIIIIAGNGQLLYANRRAAEITGYSRRDISKIHISRHIHPDELKKVLHRLARRLSGKVVPRRYETLLVRKDGSTMPIELVGAKTTWQGEPTVLAIVRDISEQKQLRENMQFYITEVTKAQETERKRIARDLHDETAQSLSMLSLEIDALREEKGLRRGLGSRLEHLRVGVEQTLEGVRRFSKELRPSILDELGLIPALQIMVDEVNVKDNINSRMDIVGAERRLPPEMEVGLFRISQEALSNIRRHSQATEVKVKAVFTPQKVKLTIKDNGVGFVLPYKLGDFTSRSKLGLYGMMERARLLDSSLKIRTRPGKGTTISIETKVGS